MDDFPNMPKWVAFLGIIFLGGIGGMVGHVTREKQKGKKIALSSLAFEGMASGFVAVLVLLLSLEMGFSLLWAAFLGGVFGYLGVAASIGIFKRFIPHKTPLEMPLDEETKG